MTTTPEKWPEPNTETVAQRLRMHMGDKKITRSKLALASGVKRSALSAKLDGQSDFTISEIIAIAHALGRPWLWVLTGRHDGHDDDGLRGARDSSLLPRMDSNHQPSDHQPNSALPADTSAHNPVRRIA